MNSVLSPLKMHTNRVRRTYIGGRLLDELQEQQEPCDGNFPEEWIASVTRANNPGFKHVLDEGLSYIKTGEEKSVTLKQMIESDPTIYLGYDMVIIEQ